MPHTILPSLPKHRADGHNAGANGQKTGHGQQAGSPRPSVAHPPTIGRRQALVMTGLGSVALLGTGLGLPRPTRAQAPASSPTTPSRSSAPAQHSIAQAPAPLQPEGAGTGGAHPPASAPSDAGSGNAQDSHSARQAQLLEPNPAEFKREFDSFVGGEATHREGLKLDVPVLADNPSAVPVKVAVTRPITDEDWCEELILLAEKNPIPLACRLFFSPQARVAEAAVRVRLSQSQTLHALARMKSGQILVAKQEVTVAASGCGM